jgi:hypothetical protein
LRMHRIVSLLLAAFFALHSGLIAAANYCDHDKPVHSDSHLGHHEHQHVGDEVPQSTGAVDLDCGTCHLSGVGFLETAGANTLPSALTDKFPPAEEGESTIASAGLYRPPILPLA